MKIKVNKKKIWLSFFLFLFLFAPPIIPNLNLMYFVSIYSICALFILYKKNLMEIIFDSNFKKFNIKLFIVLVYYFLMMSLSIMNQTKIEMSNYFTVIYRFVSIFLILQPPCIYVWCIARKNGLQMTDIIECLVYCSMIEFVFCAACLLFPSVRSDLIYIMLNNTDYYTNIQSWTINSRFYGFAASMTDYFGFLVGIIASICFLYALKYKIKYLFFLPFLLLMIVLNATTGLIIFATAIITFGLNKLFNGMISRKDILIILIVAISIPFCIIALKEFAPTGYQKIIDNFYEIFDSSKVKASNTSIRELFSARFWQIPESYTSIIFGTGHSLLKSKYFLGSDVGYINDIWSVGIIGSIIMYSAYLNFFRQGNKNKFTEMLTIILIADMFIFNIKGVTIGCNAGNAVIILLMFFIYFDTLPMSKNVSV